jgi:hypothetical protein
MEETQVRWPSDEPGANYDWFEFSVKGDPDEQGEVLRVKVNVSFMLSTWKCIFGQGCPGVLISGAMTDRGCCQIGVHMEHSDDDFKRVRGFVDQLTEEDLDENLLKIVKSNNGKGWRYQDKSDEGESALEGFPWHTKVVDGACVLANRAGGSTGKLGCSLHVLANRLGLHHSDTKPNICWQIPMAVTEEYDEDIDQTTMTVDGTPAKVWGSTDMRNLHSPGWWCTETPDAYVIGNTVDKLPGNELHSEEVMQQDFVFRTNEVELRKMMGDHVYDEMVKHLQNIISMGGRRAPMPGETVNGSRPLIPLIVKKRFEQWHDEEADEELKRSHPYMREHPDSAPDGYKVPRLLRRNVQIVEVNQPASTGGTIREVNIAVSTTELDGKGSDQPIGLDGTEAGA